jgi:hypothetical protein
MLAQFGAMGVPAVVTDVGAFAVFRTNGPGNLDNGLFALPATPASYLGWYPAGVPRSYAGVSAVSAATGVKPALVPYYSGWFEPFQASFATAVNC